LATEAILPAFEAKVVTATRFLAALMTSSNPWATARSDGDTPSRSAFVDVAYNISEDTIDTLPRPKLRADEIVEEFVRRAVRRAMDMHWGKKPQCLVTVHRV